MSWTPYEAQDYLDFPALEAACRALAAAAPEWVSLQVIGQSRGGRPLLLLTIGADPEDADRRPALWLDGGTHAAEWTGVSAALFAATSWVRALQSDAPGVRSWFTQQAVHVLPCISPDGYQRLFEGGAFVRSNTRPPPEGTVRSGHEAADMDGDGVVRWMRWRDPTGPFVPHEGFPGQLRHRTLDDPADAAFQVCAEGRFVNWDGTRLVAAPLEHGLDLNRNFPGSWSPFRMFGMDGGDYPLSEPTSRAVVEAVRARPGVAIALTNHTFTGAMLTQPYRTDGAVGPADQRRMELLAEQLCADTHYRVVRVVPDFVYDPQRPIVGVWSDTLSSSFGIPAWTLELWDPFAFAGVEVANPAKWFTQPDPDGVHKMIEAFRQEPGAWQDWTGFEHPQLGTVEIGGLDRMKTLRNPPERLLLAECQAALRVADRARRAVPRLEVVLLVHRRGEDQHDVEVRIHNRGFLPTSGTTLAETAALVPGIAVRVILGPDMSLVQGRAARDLGHLDGWGDALIAGAAQPLYPRLPARGSSTQTVFAIRGKGKLTVQWLAPRAGRGERSQVL